MSTPIAIFRHLLSARLAYRHTLLFSSVLHPLAMLLTLLMLKGIYAHHGQASLLGYSLPQMVWYFGAAQFFYQLVWNTVEKDIGERLLRGRLDQDLVRPFSLLAWELLQVTTQKVLCFVFEFVPVSLVYALICFPDFMSVAGFVQYLVLTLFACLQFLLMSFVLASLTFVWQDPSSLSGLKLLAVNLLSGVAIPLAFFPERLQKVILSLPFRYLFHTPVAHLLGQANVRHWGSFLVLLAEESVWSAFLLVLAWGTYRSLIARLASAGG